MYFDKKLIDCDKSGQVINYIYLTYKPIHIFIVKICCLRKSAKEERYR